MVSNFRTPCTVCPEAAGLMALDGLSGSSPRNDGKASLEWSAESSDSFLGRIHVVEPSEHQVIFDARTATPEFGRPAGATGKEGDRERARFREGGGDGGGEGADVVLIFYFF